VYVIVAVPPLLTYEEAPVVVAPAPFKPEKMPAILVGDVTEVPPVAVSVNPEGLVIVVGTNTVAPAGRLPTVTKI
jgi:hypothetical protein